MKILAIETSCDETAICLLQATETDSRVDFTVIHNITHTQLEHVAFGGVFPAVAKREHQVNLPIILEQIMKDQEKPDVVCVTNGPGLEPALWCGITFAKELGNKWKIPVIPVNHMEGHILSVFVPNTPQAFGQLPFAREHRNFTFDNTINFPALALLISGGHTELVLVRNIGDYEIIGKTRDDAVGEAFDKVARMMDLPYPGGPEISKLAEQFSDKKKFELPRPMMHTKDYDFSFSGLKTAVLYYIQSLEETISDEKKQEIAYEFQNAVSDVLVYKTKKAMIEFGIQTLIVAGGVSANKKIISDLQTMVEQEFPETQFLAPAKELTGDNALMIALAGYFKIQKNPDADYGDIRAVGNLGL